jgi:hypothetical protein
MSQQKPDSKNLPPLRFRPLDTVGDLELIASERTSGNLSEAIRVSIRETAQRVRDKAAA